MIDLRPSSSASHPKATKPETTPSTRQLAELSHTEPILGKNATGMPCWTRPFRIERSILDCRTAESTVDGYVSQNGHVIPCRVALSVCLSSSRTPIYMSAKSRPHRTIYLTVVALFLEKRLQEVQRLHFEQQIDELQTRLIETDEKNAYLMRIIDQLNHVSSPQSQSATSPAVSFLLPDPK